MKMQQKTKFKQTEIGLIPEDWVLDTVENQCDIIMGQSPPSEYYTQNTGDLPFLQGIRTFCDLYPCFDTYCSSPKKIAAKGDILLSVRAPVGETNIAPRELCIGRGLASLRMKNQNNHFLLYLLRNFKNNLIAKGTGTVYSSVNKSTISNLRLPFPPLPEQRAIAELLTSLDDKIELNRRMSATLEQIAQAIFKQWFIDFEFPDENGQPYKSSGGEMVESELGEIPRGWEVKDIGDICKTFGGGTPKTKEPSYWEDGDIFWATPTDMTSLKSPIIFDTSRKITEEGLNKSSAKLLPIGSVLMTSRATLGYFAITKVPICTNQGFISMVCDGEVSNYYLLHTLKNKVELIENLASGSTYLEINKSSFRSISVIIPPSSLIEKFDNFVKLIYDKIYLYESESQNLSLIRDELLPKLMSGKIRLL